MKVRLTTNYSFALLFTVLICTSCTTRRQIQTDKFLPNEIPSATTEIVNAANPQRPASKEILDGMKISVVTFRETNAKLHYEANLDYPQIDRANTRQQKQFNQLVKNRIFKELSWLKSYSSKNILRPNGEKRKSDFEITTKYTSGFAREGILSLELHIETSTGYVHPDRGTIVLNYDLTQGKELMLADLFVPKSQFLERIAEQSIIALKKKSPQSGGDWIPSQLESGTTPLKENYDLWSLDNEVLVITFDVYQIGPGSMGINFATIPYDSIKDILKPEMLRRLKS